jgi:hypothetical protein
MRGSAIIAIATLLLGACGASSSAPLNPAFARTWNGNLAADAGILGSEQAVPAEFVVTVVGNSASVAGICLDGSGSLDLGGSGNEAAFAGAYVCGPTPFLSCASVIATYTSSTAIIAIGPEDGFNLLAIGEISGCGKMDGLTTTLDALYPIASP